MPALSRSKGPSPAALLAAAVAVYIFLQAYSIVSQILIILLLTILISLALNPLVARLRDRLGGRMAATGLVVFLFFAVAAAAGFAFYQPISRSAGQILQRVPEYWERIQKPLIRLEHRAAISEEKLKSEVSQETPAPEPVNAQPAKPSEPVVKTTLNRWAGGMTTGFLKVASTAASVVFIGVTVFFSVTFTLLNPRPLMAMIFSLIPHRFHATALQVIRNIVDFIPQWARATFIGMLIVGALVFLVMWPVFGFQDAVVLGLIALLFEALPYVGPILSTVPALLLALSEGGWTPFWVVAAYAGIQFLENNLIYPWVVGTRLELHPVAVIFSMLLCVAAFGVLGVLLAVPMAGVLRILHQEIYRSKFLPGVSDVELERMAADALRGSRDEHRRTNT